MTNPDLMEKGVDSRRTSSSSSSDDSDSAIAANADDPWAIVELVDDSEKWAGMLQKMLALVHKETIYRNVIFHHESQT